MSIRFIDYAGLALLVVASATSACHRVLNLPTQVTVTEIEPSDRAARSPDCTLPVLRSAPKEKFLKIAIIEGVGDVYGDESKVMPAVIRKACETGADAILIVESQVYVSGDLGGMVGYYVNAAAIEYVAPRDNARKGQQLPDPLR